MTHRACGTRIIWRTRNSIRAFLVFALGTAATACAVSTQQEVQMGQNYAAQVEKLTTTRDSSDSSLVTVSR